MRQRSGVGGGLDLLVNNAGRWTQSPVTDGWEKALADWDLIMDTNLKGVVMFGRACVPHLIGRGGGNIINVSTYYVLPARSEGTNPPGTDLYASSKWAMNGLTQAWSQKLAEHGIRVNALCMGATDAPMLREPVRRRPARGLRRHVDDARARSRAWRSTSSARVRRAAPARTSAPGSASPSSWARASHRTRRSPDRRWRREMTLSNVSNDYVALMTDS